ncbi:MAG: phasin family protein [Pseudomonadota bacterium]|nr:phasin family protein [Pseudomonadota bacterium]
MANVNVPSVKPEALVALVVKANRLAVANLEKLAEFQKDALPGYVNVPLAQLKAAVEVTDAESAKVFANSQVEAGKALNAKLVADAKALAELLSSFVAGYNALAKDSVAEFAPKAA